MNTRSFGANSMVWLSAVGGCAVLLLSGWWIRQSSRIPAPRFVNVAIDGQGRGSVHSKGRAGESSSGWYLGPDDATSVRGAVGEAVPAGSTPPDFAMIVYGNAADGAKVLSAARDALGPKPRIFGLRSHRPEVLDAGSLSTGKSSSHGVAILTVRSPRIRFGVGAADFRGVASPREAGRDAVKRAVQDAGRTVAERPQVILVAPTGGSEEQVIAGIEDVVGRSVPMLGGTAGPGPSIIGGGTASTAGVSVAVIYTGLSLGWTFEAGYDVSLPQSGIVTKTDGRIILEIDHRPAWEVYDEWLDGRLSEAARKGVSEAGILLALNPCYREYKAPSGQVFAAFSHAWPTAKNGSLLLAVSTSIQPGDRIHLSHGTWEVLMNRAANLPPGGEGARGAGRRRRAAFRDWIPVRRRDRCSP